MKLNMQVGLGPGHPHCVRWGAGSPSSTKSSGPRLSSIPSDIIGMLATTAFLGFVLSVLSMSSLSVCPMSVTFVYCGHG